MSGLRWLKSILGLAGARPSGRMSLQRRDIQRRDVPPLRDKSLIKSGAPGIEGNARYQDEGTGSIQRDLSFPDRMCGLRRKGPLISVFPVHATGAHLIRPGKASLVVILPIRREQGYSRYNPIFPDSFLQTAVADQKSPFARGAFHFGWAISL